MNRVHREPRPQARREAILDEAIHMLGQSGFNGLTVQALAGRCGISNAGLLYYFGSKDELLLAVLDAFELRERDHIAPFVAAAQGAGASQAAAQAGVVELLRQMVLRLARRPELARFLFVLQAEALDGSHPAHGWFRQRDTLTTDLFVALLTGLLPDPATAARQLISAMHGLGLHWLRHDSSFDLAAEWEQLAALILANGTGATP